MARRLDAEEVSAGLRANLTEARGLLQVKSDEYDRLSSTVLAVCGDLQVVQEEGAGSPHDSCCWYHGVGGPA